MYILILVLGLGVLGVGCGGKDLLLVWVLVKLGVVVDDVVVIFKYDILMLVNDFNEIELYEWFVDVLGCFEGVLLFVVL